MAFGSVSSRISSMYKLAATFLAIIHLTLAQVNLPDNRQPALWTENFGDCLGNSLIDVSRFDAALYLDNLTVTFHLQGQSVVSNLNLMMYIGVYAYGESRFTKIFDPCGANIIR
jgi:hypothetical protein